MSEDRHGAKRFQDFAADLAAPQRPILDAPRRAREVRNQLERPGRDQVGDGQDGEEQRRVVMKQGHGGTDTMPGGARSTAAVRRAVQPGSGGGV
ncbi:hypothetical protein J4558_27915 [Leptolyngbya sp. 15MV]|nr:hypothetical protein J4558_27915 [Leptolyngbya sp. 15MV]